MRGGANKEKGRKALAWISFGFAAVAGVAVAATFVGAMFSGLLGMFPGWVPAVALAGAAIAMGIDLFIDGEPNQVALYTVMALPTLARSAPGRFGDEVTRLGDNLLASVTGQLGLWLGVTSAIGVAAACGVIAYLMGRRVVAKGRA